MLPERVIEVVNGGAFAQIGTRDSSLRPSHATVVGARVHEDRQTISVFVPAARSERILQDLNDNGQVAVGFGLPSHESYQIKGSYLSSGPADEGDRALQESSRADLLKTTLAAGYPDEVARPLVEGFAYTPAVAITFHAEEVFLQTPGPEAGKSLL